MSFDPDNGNDGPDRPDGETPAWRRLVRDLGIVPAVVGAAAAAGVLWLALAFGNVGPTLGETGGTEDQTDR